MEVTRSEPGYSPNAVGIGIVHIGLGAFHRAHEAVYIDRWLDRNAGGPWGICAANIRSNREIVHELDRRDGQFHVVQFADRNHAEIRRVQSIRRAVFAADDKAELLSCMTAPTTRIVSLTVTEKAYCLNPATGELNHDDPAIAHDIAQPGNPRTVPGVLLEALRRRRAANRRPFTVLCCDNMPGNGTRTRDAVTGLAEAQAPGLARWVADAVDFPSTMADRIVPAVTESRRVELERLIGVADRAAVACESFSQWVIEDRFRSGRPDWEREDVEMVDDVRPFETMKLRMLNGAHSLLAYVGLARGRTTVAEAVADPELNGLVRDYFAEVASGLPRAAGLDASAYAAMLLRRFGNDALEHRLAQIAMDGSQKLPQRWLEGALANLERGLPIRVTARAVAAWMAYVRGEDNAGNRWQVDDPLAERLAGLHRRHSGADELVAALLAVTEIFPEALAAREPFRHAVARAYAAMSPHGRDD